MTMTLKALTAQVNALGMTIRKTGYGDEMRIAFPGKHEATEPSAAYVDDRDEALSTAIAMAAISVAYWTEPVAPVSLA
jgi:hypothetical protein